MKPYYQVLLLIWFCVIGSSLHAEEQPAFDPLAKDALRAGMPDPAIIEAHDGSGFYVFATGHGVVIWHSTDLKQWTRLGTVFDRHVPAWAEQAVPGCDGIWAPDIQYANGQYFLYYSVSTFGSQRSVIGLAVNRQLDPKHPDYRWQDRGVVVESLPNQSNYNAIDSAMFVDSDQKAYLVWGSYWTGIKGCEIDLASGKPASTQPKTVALATRSSQSEPPNIEAPFLIKRDKFYYLMASWDFCCAGVDSTYKVVIGRSRSPLGPYVDKRGRQMKQGGGTVILASGQRWRGPGHNCFLRSRRGDFLVHHVYDATAVRRGRILQVRPVTWSRDGWPQVGDPLNDAQATQRNRRQLSPLVGRWEHVVNQKDRYDIYFEVSGELSGTAGRAFWKREANQLTLRWLDPRAPQGAWIDKVRLSSDGMSYSGTNQNGTRIQGRKVVD